MALWIHLQIHLTLNRLGKSLQGGKGHKYLGSDFQGHPFPLRHLGPVGVDNCIMIFYMIFCMIFCFIHARWPPICWFRSLLVPLIS